MPVSPPPSLHELTGANDGETLAIATGDTISLRLAATAGTGYAWDVVSCPTGLEIIDLAASPRPGSERLAGGPLDVVLSLRAAAPCTGNLELHYRRPWETGTPPAQTFLLTLVERR